MKPLPEAQDELPPEESGRFVIPDRARLELARRGVDPDAAPPPANSDFRPPPGPRRPCRFDWPGIGAAVYSVAEQDAIYSALAEACSLQKGDTRRRQLVDELATAHAMKVQFEVDLSDDRSAEFEPFSENMDG